MVALTLDGALTETQRSRRRIALFLRKNRVKRKRAKEVLAAMNEPAIVREKKPDGHKSPAAKTASVVKKPVKSEASVKNKRPTTVKSPKKAPSKATSTRKPKSA